MLQISKSQKKKAKKQQKAAMQLAESAPEALSPMDGASPALASTSGAELQVCSLTTLLDHILRFCWLLFSLLCNAEPVYVFSASEWQQVTLAQHYCCCVYAAAPDSQLLVHHHWQAPLLRQRS